jgi:hypothetical protein
MTQQHNIAELIARWDSGDGKPYKGSLIDWTAHENQPDDIGCMCAQGQVLHLVGGWEPERIRDIGAQSKADREVAKLLNISVAHAILLRNVNDNVDGAPSIVLTDPAKVLGDQAHIVLAFWLHLDAMNVEQWAAAGDAARAAAWAAARAAAGDAAWDACSEIQGARLLREQGKPFFFLPMFGFDSPDAIPALPADYGIARAGAA